MDPCLDAVGQGARRAMWPLPLMGIQGADRVPPGEMLVEQQTRSYARLNQKTAKALGLALPESPLLQATELIK